jgi:bifunctional DNase/RNase
MKLHRKSPAIIILALAASLGCSKKPTGDERAQASASGPAPAAPAPAAAGEKPAAPPNEPSAESTGTPNGYVKMSVGGVAPTSAGEAVLLVDTLTNVAIPIFIGGTEALSIQLRLEKREFARPLTHDLYDATLKKLGGRVESVRVDRLQNNTYYGTVVVLTTQNRVELDARPSDAIALAIGNHAPIHVARSVINEAGIKFNDLPHGKSPPKDLPVGPADKRPDPIAL